MKLRLFEDTVHVFPLLSFLPEADEALAELASFLREETMTDVSAGRSGD